MIGLCNRISSSASVMACCVCCFVAMSAPAAQPANAQERQEIAKIQDYVSRHLERGDKTNAEGWVKYGIKLAKRQYQAAEDRKNYRESRFWATQARQLAENVWPAGDPRCVEWKLLHVKTCILLRRALRNENPADDEADQLLNEAEASAVQLLAVVHRTLKPGDMLFRASHDIVKAAIWDEMLETFSGEVSEEGRPILEVAQRFQSRIDRFEKQLIGAGVPPAWATLGQLRLAKFLYDLHLIDQMQGPLDRLAGALVGPDDTPADQSAVSPADRTMYLNYRGLYETEKLNYENAYDLFHRRLAISQKRALWIDVEEQQRMEARSWNDIGYLKLVRGDYAGALLPLNNALKIYHALGDYNAKAFANNEPRTVHALFTRLNLAEAYKRGEKFTEASEHARFVDRTVKQEPVFQTIDAKRLHVMCLNGLGMIEATRGRFEAAAKHLDEARELATHIYGAGHVRLGEIDVNLGWLELEQNKLAAARGRFESALRAFERHLGGRSPRLAECKSYLARVRVQLGKTKQARRMLDEAMRDRRQFMLATLRSTRTERERLAFVQELRIHAESTAWPGVLDTYLELANQLEIPAQEQYRHVLNWKGILASRVLPDAGELENDADIQALARKRQQTLDELQPFAPLNAYSHREGLPISAEEFTELTDLERQAERLERELAAKSARFRAAKRQAESTPEQVARALSDDRALLDIIEIQQYQQRQADELGQRDRRYVAFLVRPDRPVARIQFADGGRATDIDAHVDNFYNALTHKGEVFPAFATQLAQMIRDPVLPHLEGVKTLIVSGDGKLQRLPWGALPAAKRRDAYWIEEIALAAVTSAHSLVDRQRPQQPIAQGALLVGDVDFGPAAGGPWPSWDHLDGTAKEVQQVENVFSATRIPTAALVKHDATEAAVVSSLPKHRYVHLATHGFFVAKERDSRSFDVFDLRDQLSSALVLAGANAGDNYLTAEELGRLNLRNVQLMVLSACETGLGHVSEGQGLIGLLGSLDQAGVGTVVSSLWPVADDPTSKLMVSFYEHLLRQKQPRGPAEALRAAQLTMIRSGTTLADPFFWAPWIVSGLPE